MSVPVAMSPYVRTRPRAKPDWKRARAAARALAADPQQTHMALEVTEALEPDQTARGLATMVAHREGRRLFRARPDLQRALQDRGALERMPAGSLGRAYLAHIDAYGLSPGKLVELGRQARAGRTVDEDVSWFGERSALVHDLRHVLTGYGADGPGETLLLWFSHGHEGGRANALLMTTAALRLVRAKGPGFLIACLAAWRRGRRAALLSAMPFETLLPRPLDEVRRLAGLAA